MTEEEIEDLRAQVRKARQDAADKRIANKALTKENERLAAEVSAVAKRADELGFQTGKPSAQLQAQIDELTSKNRALNHRYVFRDKAIEAGVEPTAVDTLWRESGYQPESDEVDDEALVNSIEAAKTSHPFLFRPDDTANAANLNALKPPLGKDRGGPAPKGLTVKASELRNPAFVLANQKAINEHTKAGTYRIDWNK